MLCKRRLRCAERLQLTTFIFTPNANRPGLWSIRNILQLWTTFFNVSRVLRDSTPCSVRPSVLSVPFILFIVFLPHCSCPNGLLTSDTAHTHPFATGEAVYAALLVAFNSGPIKETKQWLTCHIVVLQNKADLTSKSYAISWMESYISFPGQV